jgi:hypothetical protein
VADSCRVKALVAAEASAVNRLEDVRVRGWHSLSVEVRDVPTGEVEVGVEASAESLV